MLEPKCRLCSSSCALISLFNGKSRKNRDYIRKLVEITTGIKFEKGDSFKCICYTCSVQVYNFYIFKTRSTENERILEAQVKKDDKTKQKKCHILSLDDIPPPEIIELEKTLAPWLLSKQKYCSAENNECETNDVNTSSNANQSNVTSSAATTVESGTQCDDLQNCDLTKDSKDIVDTSTQTDTFHLLSLNKSTQCVISSTVKRTQTNTVSVKSRESQCSLLNYGEETKDSETQTDLNVSEKYTQFDEASDDEFTEPEYKCPVPTIKQEVDPLPPTCLSPSRCLRFSPSPVKPAFPIPSFSSPVLHTPTKRSKHVIICNQCNQSLNSKLDYNLHKKVHMRCNFCKKKFPSMKSTRRHTNDECYIKKTFVDKKSVVQLVKLDISNKMQEKYSRCLEEFKSYQPNDKRGVRMRSRSTSSVESVYSCCSLCRNPMSVLHGLKLGVDKAVQTGLLFGNGVISGVVNRNITTERKSKFRKTELVVPSSKRIKMSQSFTN